MKVFALSDIHVDYSFNKNWLANLSTSDFQEDILILAGDVTDSLSLLEWSLKALSQCFKKVLYVPGNHDLWVVRDVGKFDSFEKFRQVAVVAENCRVSMQPYHCGSLSIVPLLSWYDYSFGEPNAELQASWMDFHACRWPDHFDVNEITTHFLLANLPVLDTVNKTVISFSHFVPRIDVMPSYIPSSKKYLHPVLGSSRLEAQIRRLAPQIHVYGHSHVNQRIRLDGTDYINNAFGYPQETLIATKRLLCIHEESTVERSTTVSNK
jgi:predicted phosphodiesterase